MSAMYEWAKQELKYAGYDADSTEDDMNKAMAKDVLGLLETFSEQGHSGMSAPYAIALFTKLANWTPIAPLTGEETEWNQVSDDTWQNKRDSEVFKKADGQAYWIRGKVFWNWFSSPDIDNGKPYKGHYTSGESFVDITFPWTQPDKPEYVFVPTKEYPHEDLDNNTKD